MNAQTGFVPCADCGENEVDPDYTGADGRSVCDTCREAAIMDGLVDWNDARAMDGLPQ